MSLYLIYESDISIARSQKFNGVTPSFLSFPVKFLGFCLVFTVSVFLVRSIIEIFFQTYRHLNISWLLTGLISVSVINLILSSVPIFLFPNPWDMVGYVVWTTPPDIYYGC